ncbi:beta-lactamase class A [Filimonas lacunae]|uniref:Beta-lactamase n=1 Tax=Filimonas lacunae TaxID=477680 RepID=A0A173MBB3_9BACT|nr:class A beta-lactamase, subclass A2 [Filimonas lacunae]BAV04771.1 beta-lactamase [Filimonas lacunae]SIT32114.1 beta-lactamase class A [Filimonas lacunae]
MYSTIIRKTLLFATLSGSVTAWSQNTIHKEVSHIVATQHGKVGFYATVIETGDTASYNSNNKFPMQSVYKFPIAMAVLKQVDEGKLSLQQQIHILPSDIMPVGHSPIREKYPQGNTDMTLDQIITYNVQESDGTACDVLLRILGGTAKANAYIQKLGIKNINIATTEKAQQTNDMVQYKNWSTPKAMTTLLKQFYTKPILSAGSKAYLLKLMIETPHGAQRLKGKLPAGTIVAHKTGTSGTHNNLTRATNDAGIITLPNGNHIAITVFVSDSEDSQEQREGTIAAVAQAAWNQWVK